MERKFIMCNWVHSWKSFIVSLLHIRHGLHVSFALAVHGCCFLKSLLKAHTAPKCSGFFV